MADFPVEIPVAAHAELDAYADAERKIPAALDRLGQLAGREVVLLDADQGLRARQLEALGARVTAVAPPPADALRRRFGDGRRAVSVARGTSSATGLPAATADAVVSFWSALRPSGADPSGNASPDGRVEEELAESDRILRPGGRLLVVHDYARDDLSRLLPPERSPALVGWSRRDGWFAAHGFRIHVIHAFWTFPDLARLASTVEAVFGPEARRLVGDLHRPRLTWKVVVYDRVRGGAAPG